MEGVIRIQKSLQVKFYKDYANFKKSPKPRIVRSYIEARLQGLEADWDKFQSNHYLLLTMNELTEDNEYLTKNMHDDVEATFYDYKADLRELLDNMMIADSFLVNNGSERRDEPSKSVMLPKIEIPVFSGKYIEWPTFHDLFESIIHNNSELADVQKLYYLKGHITGEAEQLLRHVPITEANYEKSWNIITRRYSNKRYIANNILARLFGQRSLSFEDSNGIKNLLDTTNECLNALSNIGFDISTWDVFIIYIIAHKLDVESRKQWEQRICENLDESPNLREFNTFLEGRFRALEFLEVKEKKSVMEYRQRTNVLTVAAVVCIYCKESHVLERCPGFQQLDFNSRKEFVQQNRLCFNCFGADHTVLWCKHFGSCQRCGRRHHVLMHPENSVASQRLTNESQTQPVGANEVGNILTNLANSSVGGHSQVMLATALVKIETKKACIMLKALLDQGSQASFITERAVQFLGLRKIATEKVVSGVGGDTQNVQVRHKVGFILQSLTGTFSCHIEAYVLDCLSSPLPTNPIKIVDWPEFGTLGLADPRCDKPGKIDLLLGADLYGKILTHGLVRNPSGTLTAQNTLLGWIISGQVSHESTNFESILSLHVRDESPRKSLCEVSKLDYVCHSVYFENRENFNKNHIEDSRDYRLSKVKFGMSSVLEAVDSKVASCKVHRKVLNNGGSWSEKYKSNYSLNLNREFKGAEIDNMKRELKSDEVVNIVGFTGNVNLESVDHMVKLPQFAELMTKRRILTNVMSRLFICWVIMFFCWIVGMFIHKLWFRSSREQEIAKDRPNDLVSFRKELNLLNCFRFYGMFLYEVKVMRHIFDLTITVLGWSRGRWKNVRDMCNVCLEVVVSLVRCFILLYL